MMLLNGDVWVQVCTDTFLCSIKSLVLTQIDFVLNDNTLMRKTFKIYGGG